MEFEGRTLQEIANIIEEEFNIRFKDGILEGYLASRVKSSRWDSFIQIELNLSRYFENNNVFIGLNIWVENDRHGIGIPCDSIDEVKRRIRSYLGDEPAESQEEPIENQISFFDLIGE